MCEGSATDKGGGGARLLRALSRWPATAVVAATIVVLSEWPMPDRPPAVLFPGADKVIHWIEYAVLGVFLFRSLEHELTGHFRLAVIIAIAAGTAFGVCDEWHQSFVGRTPALGDVLADVVGLVCGVALVLTVRNRRRRHGG